MTTPAPKAFRLLISALALLASTLATLPAHAQSITAVVNGTAITSQEVSERTNFTKLTTKRTPGKREVIDQLIEEALIFREAERRRLVISDNDVDARFAAVAQTVKLSPAQLTQVLSQAGASARTFKAHIRSQLIYQRLVTAKVSTGGTISEKDIASQLMQRKSSGDKTYRYTLRQIIFVLPKDAPASAVAQRKSEATALRARFQGCDSGVALAKGLKDVAVKEPIFRTSAQLGAKFKETIEGLKVGQATPAERTDQGVEIVAICDRQATSDDGALRQEIQLKLADEQLKSESKKYLEDLKKGAIIEYK